MPLQGYPFTWGRSRGTENAVEERLDRALVTNSWLNLFPNAHLATLMAAMSDHYPIQLSLTDKQQLNRKHTFKFENGWLEENTIKDTVFNSWNGEQSSDIMDKLGRCTKDLHQWAMKLRQHYRGDIAQCKRDMEVLRNLDDEDSVIRFNEQKERLATLLVQEEDY